MFARTARLMLRPGWPEDATALAQAIGHEAVVTKLSRAPWPYALGDAQWFLQQERGVGIPNFLIFDDPTGAPRLVGGMGIDRDDATGGHEFGYWLTPDAWGRGYATEAGHAVMRIARHALGLRWVQAGHFLDNPASARVLNKLGFRPTGQIVPTPSRARGTEVPCARFAIDLDAAPCGDAPMPLAA